MDRSRAWSLQLGLLMYVGPCMCRVPMEGDTLKIVQLAAAASLRANGIEVNAEDCVVTGIFYHVIDGSSSGRRLQQVGCLMHFAFCIVHRLLACLCWASAGMLGSRPLAGHTRRASVLVMELLLCSSWHHLWRLHALLHPASVRNKRSKL